MREQVSTMPRITDVVFYFGLGNRGGCNEGTDTEKPTESEKKAERRNI